MKIEAKKISFCITCMNRLHHLQETLKKNIEDNYLPDDVEFVLLDYNSKDGLEQWVQQNMQFYIDIGILSYYKTTEPQYYLRSHSRNMVFRLASGNILCNLDADNFLGKGFAVEMIKEFEQKRNIFYTSDLSSSDAYGRVCVLKNDFLSIRGYDEKLVGYGHEDRNLFLRLEKHQLKHLYYYNQEFNNAIKHSKLERINNEMIYDKLIATYVSYIDPFASKILFLHNDLSFKELILRDEGVPDLIKNPLNIQNLGRNKFFLTEKPYESVWTKRTDSLISLQYDGKEVVVDLLVSQFNIANDAFYKVVEEEFIVFIICFSDMAVNEWISLQMISSNEVVNPDGFGKGIVYKNWNYDEPINLK